MLQNISLWLSGFKISVRSLKRTFEYQLVWQILRKTVFFFLTTIVKSKMVDGCMGAPKCFLKNSVHQDLTYCFTNFTCSYLTLHGPFPTNAPCIKINMHNWWPSWKSIWLPSPCFDINLTALIQNISFVTEMNFLSHSLGNIGIKHVFEGGHFEIQNGRWMHECITISPQNFYSSRFIVLAIWHLNLHDPFPTIAHNIKMNMLKWRPSWKSIWLPSQCFNIHLTA